MAAAPTPEGKSAEAEQHGARRFRDVLDGDVVASGHRAGFEIRVVADPERMNAGHGEGPVAERTLDGVGAVIENDEEDVVPRRDKIVCERENQVSIPEQRTPL